MNQKLLKSNLSKLPNLCYGVLPAEPKIILLKAGEKGYWESRIEKCKDFDEAERLCDYLNENIEVTKSQRKAMEFGSMWGFDVPAADPDNEINKKL